MYIDAKDNTPWYKQPWPWLLMIMPATAVVAGLYTYSLAATGSSGLVVDDYYKVGKAINHSLAKGQQASALGLQGNLALNGTLVRLLLDHAEVQASQPLVLKLFHATIPDRDQSVTLSYAGTGMWTGEIEALSAGKWHVHLLPLDENWRLEGIMPTADMTTLALQPAQ